MKTMILKSACFGTIFSIMLFAQNIVLAQHGSPSAKKEIVQSPLNDAIQLYLASNGINVYFKDQGGSRIEVIDLYNGISMGSFSTVDPGKTGNLKDSIMKSWIIKLSGKEKSKQIINRILARNMNADETIDKNTLKTGYRENNFLKGLIENYDQMVTASYEREDSQSIASKLAISSKNIPFESGGGAPVAILADGVAQFLIQRATEEFNVTVIERLKNLFNKYEELQKLFPETNTILKDIQQNNFAVSLNIIKNSFEKDIQSIIGNISKVAEINKYKEMLGSSQELCIFFAACDLVDGIRQEEKPAKILQDIYASDYIQLPEYNTANIMKLVGFISYCLRDILVSDLDKEKQEWFQAQQLQQFLKNDTIRNYFIGIILQIEPKIKFVIEYKAKDKTIKDTLSLSRYLVKVQNLTGYLTGMLQSFDKMKGYLTNISNTTRDDSYTTKINLSKYGFYADILNEIFVMASGSVSMFAGNNDAMANQAVMTISIIRNIYMPIFNTGLAIAQNIDQKQYNVAIFNGQKLLVQLISAIDNTLTGKIEKLRKELETAADKDKKKIEEQISKYEKTQKNLKIFSPYFLEYGNLIASIAVANNGQQVSEALQAAALPSGSSRIKKASNWNFALNGYLGVYYRSLQDTSQIQAKGFTKTYGFTAPVGVTISKGFKKGGSLSIFGGLIDVGAVVQYRLENDTVSKTTVAIPDIEWADIFSPSVQLVYGFPFYLPISVGAGCQWLSVKVVDSDKLRLRPYFNVFLAWDIPIINFYTRKKIK